MSTLDRDTYDGLTQDENIAEFIKELENDAVSMSQIVFLSRDGFHMQPDEATDFIHKSVFALVEAGAVPVRFGGPSHDWVRQHQYGTSPENIANAVVREWQGYGDLRFDEVKVYGEAVWFARPRTNPTYIRE
ncbi:MAG TPA: hypothetical protein PK264_21420 [Hyphomicrobiaceae bacterium]|nr:hypothetical protein [Hyphomicrobiaceae bacterium]